VSNRDPMPVSNPEFYENAIQHRSYYVKNGQMVSSFPLCGIIAIHLGVSA